MSKTLKERAETIIGCEVELIDNRDQVHSRDTQIIVTFPDFPLLPGTIIITKSEVDGINEKLFIASRKFVNGVERVSALYEDGEQRVSPNAIRKMLGEDDAWPLFFDSSQLHRIITCC